MRNPVQGAGEGEAGGGNAADGEQAEREQHGCGAGEFGYGGEGGCVHLVGEFNNWVWGVKAEIVVCPRFHRILPVLTDREYNIYFMNILLGVMKMKTAKLFQNGQSQAVRLPKEFRFEGDEVIIKKSGRAVILIPLVNSWDSLIDSLDKFTKDYLAGRDQPEQQKREALFE